MKPESQSASPFKFLKALLVAAAFSDINSADCWRRLWRALCLLAGGLRDGAKVTPLEYDRRMAICRACPVFYAPLETCGTPLKKDLHDMGCWCFMGAAARLTDKTCWLDDELGADAPHGWLKSEMT